MNAPPRLLLWLTLAIGLLNLPASAAPDPVLLAPPPAGQSLLGVVAISDNSDARDPDTLLAGAPAWRIPQEPLRSRAGGSLWLRLDFRIEDPPHPLLIELPTTALKEVSFHGPFDAAGRRLQPPHRTGLAHPYASRPLGSERVVFPLDALPGAGSYTLYARIEAGLAHTITPRAWTVRDYQQTRQYKRLFDGLCYGVLLTLLVYNLVLATVLRDRSYGYYVVTCAAALLSLATFNGHTAHLLWPDFPWLIEHSYQIFPALWLAFGALFARAFLATRVAMPKVDRALQAIAALAFLNAALGAAGLTLIAQRGNELLGLGGSLMMLAVSFRRWRGGYAPAFWYMLAILALFLTLGLTVLVSWGFSGSTFLLGNSLQAGILVEMVGLAMALSARIRMMQSEKTALTLRSKLLAEAAATDPLTGVGNRNALREGARQRLEGPGNHALLLMDLDGFKALNDGWGHAAGDEVLRSVANRLRKQLRESDLITRSGGDEFIVLLGASPEGEALTLMIERLSRELSQPIRWEGEALPMSVSIGVARWPADGRDLESLTRAADRAMYHSKQTAQGFAFAADLPADSKPG